METKSKDYQLKISSLESQVSQQMNQFANQKRQMDAMKNQLFTTLTKLKEENEAKVVELTNENCEQKLIISNLEQENDAKVQELHRQSETKASEITTLIQELTTKNQRIRSLEDQNEKYQRQVNDLKLMITRVREVVNLPPSYNSISVAASDANTVSREKLITKLEASSESPNVAGEPSGSRQKYPQEKTIAQVHVKLVRDNAERNVIEEIDTEQYAKIGQIRNFLRRKLNT